MKFLSPKIKQFLLLLLKLIVVGLAFYFIQSQLADKEWDWNIIAEKWQQPNAVFFIVGIVILTFLNRFIEILKWKNLAQIIESISIWESTKQVLIGITFGIIVGILTVLMAAMAPAKKAAKVSPLTAVSGNYNITVTKI